jgi:transposase-like protein
MRQSICSIDGCERPAHARTWCSTHYANWRRRRDPLAAPRRKSGPSTCCSVGGCDKPAQGRGWCKTHWARWKRHGDPTYIRSKREICAVAGCDSEPRSSYAEYCEMHYGRLRRAGTLEARTVWSCVECGKDFTAPQGRATGQPPLKYCSVRCGNKGSSRDYFHRKRANGGERGITLLYIAERDAWRCHLCGRVVSPKYRAPHRLSPVLDHIVPVSLGGTHTRDNVRLAHWGCNSKKCARAMNEQLLLVG